MKLIFKERYLSIDNFKDIDLPNLTVLTGVNGSGKSHLLESIQQKKSIIEGLENANIIYFNYENFKLEAEGACAAHQISSERESAWNFFEQQIKNNVFSWKTQFLGQNYEKIIDICEKKQRELWFLSKEDINDNNLYENIKKYKQHINAHFKNNNLKDNKQAQAILVLCKDIKYCISDMQKNQFITLYKPYYFKSNFLPQQIGQIIWDYYVKFRNNQVNAYENEMHKKEYPSITEKEFIKKHGDKPWEVINKILEKFNALDYKINSPEGSSSFDTFQLKLIHNTKNIEVGFETLSSGEKVLMALVASVYKSSSDKHFPDILLLDEIDASLHPSMINNLLDVIDDFFLKKGIKVILVTHSPTTVALSPEESIFVMKKNGEERVIKSTKESAIEILSEGFITLNQGIRILDEVSREKINLISEGHNIHYLEKFLELYDIKNVGVIKEITDVSGKNQLKTLFDFFVRVPHEKKIIFIWDCDATELHKLRKAVNTIPFVFLHNESNSIAKNGIENLFPLSVFDGFINKITKSHGQEIIEFDKTRKKDFMNFIIQRNIKEDFKNFEPLLNLIKETTLEPCDA